MNENDLLARWLGLKYRITPSGIVQVEDPKHPGYAKDVDFRTSNEWAGALLDKLTEYWVNVTAWPDGRWQVTLDNRGRGNGKSYIAKTWRDAVVDASLQITKRESP